MNTEEINGNKYLTLVPTNESKEKIKIWKIKKYKKIWQIYENQIWFRWKFIFK